MNSDVTSQKSEVEESEVAKGFGLLGLALSIPVILIISFVLSFKGATQTCTIAPKQKPVCSEQISWQAPTGLFQGAVGEAGAVYLLRFKKGWAAAIGRAVSQGKRIF